MTFDKLFIFKKLEENFGYLEEAKDLFKFQDEMIVSDSGRMHIAERLFQLIVDTILDVNYHFIKESDLKSAEDLQSTFYILGENGILPKDFANKIAPVTGLRNRIVHRYETLDKKLFIETFRKNLPDFEIYMSLIAAYLKNKGD